MGAACRMRPLDPLGRAARPVPPWAGRRTRSRLPPASVAVSPISTDDAPFATASPALRYTAEHRADRRHRVRLRPPASPGRWPCRPLADARARRRHRGGPDPRRRHRAARWPPGGRPAVHRRRHGARRRHRRPDRLRAAAPRTTRPTRARSSTRGSAGWNSPRRRRWAADRPYVARCSVPRSVAGASGRAAGAVRARVPASSRWSWAEPARAAQHGGLGDGVPGPGTVGLAGAGAAIRPVADPTRRSRRPHPGRSGRRPAFGAFSRARRAVLFVGVAAWAFARALVATTWRDAAVVGRSNGLAHRDRGRARLPRRRGGHDRPGPPRIVREPGAIAVAAARDSSAADPDRGADRLARPELAPSLLSSRPRV